MWNVEQLVPRAVLFAIAATLVLSARRIDAAVEGEDQIRRVLNEKGTCNILVLLKEKPHVARKLLGDEVPSVRQLQEAATLHKEDFVARMGEISGIRVRTDLWIDNFVAVDGVSQGLLDEIKDRDDVLKVFSNEPSDDANKARFLNEEEPSLNSTPLPQHVLAMGVEYLF
jgi:hypothetical protein